MEDSEEKVIENENLVAKKPAEIIDHENRNKFRLASKAALMQVISSEFFIFECIISY